MKVTINGITTEYTEGVTFEEAASKFQEEYKNQIALVVVNG